MWLLVKSLEEAWEVRLLLWQGVNECEAPWEQTGGRSLLEVEASQMGLGSADGAKVGK